MAFVARQNTATIMLEQLFDTQANRLAFAQRVNGEDGKAFDPLNVISGVLADLNKTYTPDIEYTLNKIYGTSGPAARPYWPWISAEERQGGTRQALKAMLTLDQPIRLFWISIADDPDYPRVGFRFQLTDDGDHTIVHLITPVPAFEANTPGAILNQKRRSWVIGGSPVIEKQAQDMTKVHKELKDDYAQQRRICPMPGDNRAFAGSSLDAGNLTSVIQLRHFDPAGNDPMLDEDFDNDPIAP